MPAIREFTIDYVHQDQWGVRPSNLLLMLAIYFGGIGGGLFLISVFAGYHQGALMGVLIALIGKSLSHILFLGRPSRFWRAMWRPHSSWVSRGLIFFAVFVLAGLGHLLPDYPSFQWLPWTANDWFGLGLQWVAIVGAFLTVTYTGFLMGRTSIPFWNNSLLPALFAAVSLYSGAGLSGFFLRLVPNEGANGIFVKEFAIWSGGIVLALLAFYFLGSYNYNLATRRSVCSTALSRDTVWWFYGLFLVVGLCLPLSIYLVTWLSGAVQPGLLMAGEMIEVLVGALLFRYIFFRAGVFLPVY